MRIGIDFDNTIVCYDALFHKVALEKNLIPATLPKNKSEVRDYLRRAGKEDAWTEMQGYVYGGRMAEADFYPGVRQFFSKFRTAGIPLFIISHKTKHPFLGHPYDLHAAAQGWLDQQGFFDPAQIGMPRENVFFELTKDAKLERIRSTSVTHFIDDLPEILKAPGFPDGVKRILFDSNDAGTTEANFLRGRSWAELETIIG